MTIVSLAGPLIILILLWVRPEYMFLLFYVFANWLLVFLIRDVWVLTWAAVPLYLVEMLIAVAINLAVGALFVTLFKWLKSRKSGAEKRADKIVDEARHEAAARSDANRG